MTEISSTTASAMPKVCQFRRVLFRSHDGLRNAEAMPDDVAAEDAGQQQDDDGVHHEAAQNADDVRLPGALGGVQVGRDVCRKSNHNEAQLYSGITRTV